MARCIITDEERWVTTSCELCEKEFKRRRWQPETKYCSRKCYFVSKKGVKRPPFTQEHKDKIRQAKLGKKHSEEHKIRISEGLNNSVEHKEHLKRLHIGNRGSGHGNWKGGRRYNGEGYVLVYSPNHPHPSTCERYVYEHRLIMEKHIKRFLKPSEQVHHINSIKDDNRLENLQLFKNNAEHMLLHNPKGIKIGTAS